MRIVNSTVEMRSWVSDNKRTGSRGFSNAFAQHIDSAFKAHANGSSRMLSGGSALQSQGSTFAVLLSNIGTDAPQNTQQITNDIPASSQPAVMVNIIGKNTNVSFIRLVEKSSPAEDINKLDKAKMLMLQQLLERLTGKKVRFHSLDNTIQDPETVSFIALGRENGWSANTGDMGVQVAVSNHPSEQELSFESNGVINTTDGRQIDFSVQLNLSREFADANNIPAEGNAAIDPLVINFDTGGPELTDTKISFDIDCDGDAEQISFTTGGSGFLAIDLNSDGLVNDGSELFGPRTGDGFGELSAYDSDKNNWVDENDPIYEKLRIWTKDTNGNDTLIALGVKGVGAIYLGNVGSDYSVTGSSNEVQGRITQMGIFVREDGTAGTIQDMDLVV